MSFLSDLLSFRASLAGPEGHQDPTIDRAVAEAAQQHLEKKARLEVAQEAIWTEDLRELARDDRAKVRKLEEKHLWGGGASGGSPPKPSSSGSEDSGDTVGDIIVCDDYSINRPQPAIAGVAAAAGRIPAAILGAALALGGIAGGVGIAKMLGPGNGSGQQLPAVHNTAPATPPGTPPSTVINSREGFLLELVDAERSNTKASRPPD